MILRHFDIKDIRVLKEYRYPDKTEIEILAMINDWNKAGCSGRFFEMFTIAHGGDAVGEISIYEHTPGTLSIGVHVFKPFRGRGFANFGVSKAIEKISNSKYKYAVALVDKGNEAALNLFKKLKFTQSGEFVDKDGYTIFTLKREI